MRFSRLWILAAVIALIAVVAGCGQKTAGVPGTVASVNGDKISSSDFTSYLVNTAGRNGLQTLIEERILLAWAKQEGVPVTDQQINKQIENLKRNGQYDQAVKQAGEDYLKQQLSTVQARINLAKKFYGKQITEKELKDAYDMMNKGGAQFVHPAGKQVQLIVNPDKQKMTDALNELKSGKPIEEVAAKYAENKFGGQSSVVFWIDEGQKGIPQPLLDAVKAAKVGEYGEVVGIGRDKEPVSSYVVFKVLAERAKLDLALKDVKDEVTDAVALQKTRMDQDFETRFNSQKKAAKIDIDVPRFEDVKYQFMFPQEPQPQMPMMMPQPTK